MNANIGALTRYQLPLLAGFAPVITMLLTWDTSGQLPKATFALKSFVVPLLVVEFVFVTIAIIASHRTITRPQSKKGVALCGTALVLIAFFDSLFVAPDPSYSIFRTALLILHLGFGWSIFALCRRGLFGADELIMSIMLGFVVACCFLTAFVMLIPPDIHFDWLGGLPGFDNVRRTGYYAAPILGLCLGYLATVPTKSKQVLAWVVSSCAFALIFWAGSRGALASFGLASMIGLLLFEKVRSIRLALRVGASAALGAALSYLSVPAGHMGIGRMLTPNVGGEGVTGATSGRLDLWAQTLSVISERPLLGYGEGQLIFLTPFAKEYGTLHPHNIVLQLALAWGLIGTACAFYLLYRLFREALQIAKAREDACLGPFLALAIIFLYSFVDGNLFHVQSIAMFAALAGLILAYDASGGGLQKSDR